MADDYLFIEQQGAVATMYINRPDKRNAFNLEMWGTIPKLLKSVEQNEEVKVLVIRGVDDTAFAAGADISEFETVRSSAEGAKQYNRIVLEAEASLYYFPKPTIAMIQKYCIGGGCELAVACDLRFSSDNGIFGITPAKLGLIYNLAGTKHLVDLVGPSRAKDILFSGRLLDAREAYEYGLVDRIFPNDQIVEKTYEYADLLSQRAQKTVKGAKNIISEILDGATEESEAIQKLILESYESADYKEGVRAFLEKRKPKFTEI